MLELFPKSRSQRDRRITTLKENEEAVFRPARGTRTGGKAATSVGPRISSAIREPLRISLVETCFRDSYGRQTRHSATHCVEPFRTYSSPTFNCLQLESLFPIVLSSLCHITFESSPPSARYIDRSTDLTSVAWFSAVSKGLRSTTTD